MLIIGKISEENLKYFNTKELLAPIGTQRNLSLNILMDAKMPLTVTSVMAGRN